MSRLPGLEPTDAGLLTRARYAYARRDFGRVAAPLPVMAHHTGILAGVGAFEIATKRAKRVPERLKLLGEMKAAMQVGCEWCIDIGAFLMDRHGVPAEQAQALLDHRAADVFDELEKLVIA